MRRHSEPKVFFYTTSTECNASGAAGAWYQTLLITLAEGFNELGIQHYSNHNYWRLLPNTNEFLLQHDPTVTHEDCDIVVLERQYVEENHALPKDLFKPSRKYITVYLDSDDGITTPSWLPEFRQFDFIFKPHHIQSVDYPDNIHPWTFGLTNRIIRELAEHNDSEFREKKLLVNFRHNKQPHSLRKFIEKSFVPKVESVLPIDTSGKSNAIHKSTPVAPEDPYHYLRWVQTGRRHNPSYFKSLREATACAAFSGLFLAPKVTDFNPRVSYYSSRIVDRLGIKTDRIAQWDSWRLWESLAAGCVTFHVDFEKYGFVLPVQPTNWEHYIGIDLDNIDEAIDRIRDNPELLDRIAKQGRAWVMQHYSPEATAERFLNTILGESPVLACV
jgi:hypothetical protein